MAESLEKKPISAVGLVKKGVRALRESNLARNGYEAYQLGSRVTVSKIPHYVVAFKIDDKGERQIGILDEINFKKVGFLLRDIKESRKLSTPLYDMFNRELKDTEAQVLQYAEDNTKFFPFSMLDSEENVRNRAVRIKKMRASTARSKAQASISNARFSALESGALPNVYAGRI